MIGAWKFGPALVALGARAVPPSQRSCSVVDQLVLPSQSAGGAQDSIQCCQGRQCSIILNEWILTSG